jgi:hypothetical protein
LYRYRPDSFVGFKMNMKPVIKALSNPALFATVTNVVAGIGFILSAYFNIEHLKPHTDNIPLLVAGSFPILASGGMLLGVVLANKRSITRILFIVGMVAVQALGV